MNKSLVGLVLLGCYICLFSTYYFDFCLYPFIPIYTKNTYLSTFIQNSSKRSACTSAYEVAIKLGIIFALFLPETLCWKKKLWQLKIYFKISTDPDGGPRSHVRKVGHSAQPPIDVSGNFSPHVSAELP